MPSRTQRKYESNEEFKMKITQKQFREIVQSEAHRYSRSKRVARYNVAERKTLKVIDLLNDITFDFDGSSSGSDDGEIVDVYDRTIQQLVGLAQTLRQMQQI